MRKRQEIHRDLIKFNQVSANLVNIGEILLDIRELLQDKSNQ